MIGLFEGGRCRGVPIFNVKPTRETNVPIVVAFINIRIVRVPNRRRPVWDGRLERHDAAAIRDNLVRSPACNPQTLGPHVIRKWSTALSTPTTTTAPTATTSAGKLLLNGDCELLDRGNHGCGATCGMVDRRRRER